MRDSDGREYAMRLAAQQVLWALLAAHAGKKAIDARLEPGDDVARLLKRAGGFLHDGSGPVRTTEPSPALQAIAGILRAHIRNESFAAADIRQVQACLNRRVTGLKPATTAAEWNGGVYVNSAHPGMPSCMLFLLASGSSERFAAEALLNFLRLAVSDEPLKRHPLGICERCSGIFLKVRHGRGRADQCFCSSNCRVRRWMDDKASKDPSYFKEKMKKHRQNVKEPKRKITRRKRRRKGGVKSG